MAEQRVRRRDIAMAALQEKLAELQQKARNIPQGIVDKAQSLDQMVIDQANSRIRNARDQQISNISGGYRRQVEQGNEEIFKLLAAAIFEEADDVTVAAVKQRIGTHGLDSVLKEAAGNTARPKYSVNTAYQAANEAIANDPNIRRVGGPLAAAAGVAAGTGALMEWNDPDRGFAIVAGPNVNQAAMQDIIEFLENGDPLRRETETIA